MQDVSLHSVMLPVSDKEEIVPPLHSILPFEQSESYIEGVVSQ